MNEYFNVLKKYATFTGRAGRKEYWMFFLFQMIFVIITMLLDNVVGTAMPGVGYGAIYIAYVLATMIPSIAVTVRRLHDVGKSGWMYLILFIPLVGAVWLLILLIKDSDSAHNVYGSNPKNVYCGQCGTQNTRSAKFCKECGGVLGSGTVTTVSDTTSKRNDLIERRVRAWPSGLLVAGILLICGVGYVGYKVFDGSIQEWFTPFTCGKSQIKDASGNTYGTVIAEDGRCWLDRNLGASRVATSPADEASYGWYFQWGRGADGHQISSSGTTFTQSPADDPGHANFIITDRDWRNPSNGALWQGVDGVNNPCPVGFQVPTGENWGSLYAVGVLDDSLKAFNSRLKLPAAGYRSNSDGKMWEESTGSQYWTSTDAGPFNGHDMREYVYIYERGSAVQQSQSSLADGMAIRCVKEDLGKTLYDISDIEALIRDGKNDEAIAILTAQYGTLAIDSNIVIEMLNEMRNYDVLVEILERRVNRFPDDVQVKTSLAFAYNELDRKDEAIALLQNIIKSHPEHAVKMNDFIRQIQSGNRGESSVATNEQQDACGTTQVQDTYGNMYSTITAADGKCWLDRNLGATRVATAYDDVESYGYYYQHGRGADGHELAVNGVPESNTTSTLSGSTTPGYNSFITRSKYSNSNWMAFENDNLWKGADGINNPCPTGFRVPTLDELKSVLKEENITSIHSAFSSSLKLPAAGNRDRIAADVYLQGEEGLYWTTTSQALTLDANATFSVSPRSDGYSVRCIQN